MTPKELLLRGVEILDPILTRAGFRFELGDCGTGSGGEYASGAYSRGHDRLELHFRTSLGLVTYHLGKDHIGHHELMQALGHAGQAAYPGYAADPLAAFHDLASDLEQFGHPFLQGNDVLIRRAAREAMQRESAHWQAVQAGWEGDRARRDRARELFYEGRYSESLAQFRAVKHTDLLTPSERRMWYLAEDRASPED